MDMPEEERSQLKRLRSTSPTSLLFSEQDSKRLKTEDEGKAETFLNAEDEKHFKSVYKAMHDFVFEDIKNGEIDAEFDITMRLIWKIRHKVLKAKQEQLLRSLDAAQQLGSSIIKTDENLVADRGLIRLSNRLKYISLHRSLASPVMPTGQTNTTNTQAKPVERKQMKLQKKPIEEVVNDMLQLDAKYLFKGMSREPVCKYCCKTDNVVACQGYCLSHMHVSCGTLETSEINIIVHQTADSAEQIGQIKHLCHECRQSEVAFCIVCRKITDAAGETPIRCNMSQCGRYVHEMCCKYWPQAKFLKSNNIVENCRCPAHVCHTCVSDDPKGKFHHSTQSKLTRCIKCLATYHTDSACIPAGSKILSAAFIICPRHAVTKSDQQLNVNWCFICVGGGSVICCETCPIAVHGACLKLPLKADEGYICEECESGRLPLYGELVWAKFNSYRWWPALILPPTQIPTNVQRLPHNEHDIALRFFGTHDHAWISRRRVYLFVDGDQSESQRQKQGSNRDKNYILGVKEAARIHDLITQRKQVLRLTKGSAGGGVEKKLIK